MRTIWKVLLIVAFIVAVLALMNTPTPLFGPRLTLKREPVVSIEFPSMFGTNRMITESNQIAQVVETLSNARKAGPAVTTPILGSLVIHYADGTTNGFYISSSRRFAGMDLVDKDGVYTISTGKIFGTLRRVGLMPEEAQ